MIVKDIGQFALKQFGLRNLLLKYRGTAAYNLTLLTHK